MQATNLLLISAAAAATLAMCFFARPLGKGLGLLDEPLRKQHSRHTESTPLVGGIAVLTPFLTIYFLLPIINQFSGTSNSASYPIAFGVVVAFMMLLGAFDDRMHITANKRLLLSTIALFVFVQAFPGMRIPVLYLPNSDISLALGWFTIPFTSLCLVALVNAVNMADGRNGLVIGINLIWAIALLAPGKAIMGGLLFQPMLAASLAIALICNLRGRLFLGDAGTYGLATFIGLTVVALHNLQPQTLTTTQIAVLFLIPVLDMGRVMIARIRRGVSPFLADHGHLHHFIDDWIGWPRGLFVYLGIVALPIAIAFTWRHWAGESVVLGIILYFMTFFMARNGVLAKTIAQPDK